MAVSGVSFKLIERRVESRRLGSRGRFDRAAVPSMQAVREESLQILTGSKVPRSSPLIRS